MSLKIYLIARTQLETNPILSFLNDRETNWIRSTEASEAEELVEFAGRVCYMSFGNRQSPRTNEEYIGHLITQGHESVLEHITWTFVLTGVSRAFSHQLVRHRAGFAFSQLSQQYHEELGARFVEPAELRKHPKALSEWRTAVDTARAAYAAILQELEANPGQFTNLSGTELKRLVRSAARSVLPNATETIVVMTANARALRHFLSVRGGIPGDEEMRIVCAELLKCLKTEAPSIFSDFRVESLPSGSPTVVSGKLEEPER